PPGGDVLVSPASEVFVPGARSRLRQSRPHDRDERGAPGRSVARNRSTGESASGRHRGQARKDQRIAKNFAGLGYGPVQTSNGGRWKSVHNLSRMPGSPGSSFL